MNKNFSRIINSFADDSPNNESSKDNKSSNELTDSDENKIPYSQYIENIHSNMIKDPKLAKIKYKTDPTKYYLVFNSANELNDGTYDSISILALFTPFLDQIIWSEPNPLYPNTEIGKVYLFYPELNIDARVVKNKDELTIHAPIKDFNSIKDKLDLVEFYKSPEEKSEEVETQQKDEILNSPPPVTPVESK